MSGSSTFPSSFIIVPSIAAISASHRTGNIISCQLYITTFYKQSLTYSIAAVSTVSTQIWITLAIIRTATEEKISTTAITASRDCLRFIIAALFLFIPIKPISAKRHK